MDMNFHSNKTDNQKIRLAQDALLYVALDELFTEPFKLKTDHSLEYLVYFNFNGNYPIAKVFPKN